MTTLAKDGIGEMCIVNGLGNIALVGAIGGAEKFALAYADGDSNIPVKVELIDSNNAVISWERVRCTYLAAGDQLVRGAIMGSSNAGAPVNFGSGIASRAFVFLPSADIFSGSYNDLSDKPSIEIDYNVKFVAQAIATPQKTQARTNIGAISSADAYTIAEASISDFTTYVDDSDANLQAQLDALPSGSDGQMQYNNGGTFGGASGVFYDDVNGRLGIGTTEPTHLFHAKKTGYTTTYFAPGDICAVLMENGEANSRKSKFSIAHAYHPAEVTDIYSLVVDAGYDTPAAPYSQCSLGIGTLFGPARTNLFLKGLGLYFSNSNCNFSENTYPTSQSLRTQINNATGTFYVNTQGYEASFGVNAAAGVYVRCDADSKTLLQASVALGGTKLWPRTAADVALTLQMQASQTGAALQAKNSGGGVVVEITADGDVKARSFKPEIFTVATLPTTNRYIGMVCSVNNALAPAYNAPVVAGGGRLVDVKWDGTDWNCC